MPILYEIHVIITIIYLLQYRCIDVYLTFAYNVIMLYMYVCCMDYTYRYGVIRFTERTFVNSK